MTYPPNPPSDPNQNPWGSESGPQSGPQPGAEPGPQGGVPGSDQPTTAQGYPGTGGQYSYGAPADPGGGGYQPPAADPNASWGAAPGTPGAYPGAGAPGAYPGTGGQQVAMDYPDLAPDADRSFMNSLFDLSFRNFVTLKVIPILYVISLVVISIGAAISFITFLIGSIGLFSDGDGGQGFLSLVVAIIIVPLVWLLYVVLARVVYEFFIAIIRIADNTDPRHQKR